MYPETFSPAGSHAILMFAHRTLWQYSDGDPVNGGVECNGEGKNRDLSQYLAPSRAVNASTA